MRQELVFRGQRGSGDLHEHQSGLEPRRAREEGWQVRGEGVHHAVRPPLGDSAELSERERGEVQRYSQRCSVEIAARQYNPRAREDQRVIRGAVHFDFEHALEIRQSISNGPVDLWHAPQAVGVLDARAAQVRAADAAATIQAQEISRRKELPRVWPRPLEALVEGSRRATQGVEGQSPGDVGGIHKDRGAPEGDEAESRHHLSAVDERQTLFRLELQRPQARPRQRRRGTEALSPVGHFALSDQSQRHVRERGQVAARSDRAA